MAPLSLFASRALLRAPCAHFPLASFHSSTGPLRTRAAASLSASNDSTSPLISVRNAAKTHGELDVLLPLPGVKGLTRLGLNDTNASVYDVIEAVKRADASLKAVEIATPDGTKLARTSDAAAMDDRRAREDSVAFATVKAEIEKDPRLIDPQLENAVILRPYSLESVLSLQNSLDSEMYNIKHDRKVKERQLAELNSSLKKLQQAENEVHLAARRMPNAQKWVGLTGLTGFYGALMYCVWDVYSWDVMEPITYFIGFTAVLGNSFYSSITKKDPTYSNMFQKRYLDRVELLSKERKLDLTEIQKLKARITDLENDITLLSQWEKMEVPSPNLH
eukprot:jgi/Phyca11/537183/estExt2_fgenesh1_pg.C_PHYCAscaffold_770016